VIGLNKRINENNYILYASYFGQQLRTYIRNSLFSVNYIIARDAVA
jgi:hypothetical protein